VFVEEFVDQFDDNGLRLNLLRGRSWAHGGERLDFAALKADVNLGGSFRRHLKEGDILNDMGEQPFAFTGRRIWICPKLSEVYRHRDQPLADSFVEDELIMLSCALSIFAGFGQHAKLLVPFTFERVSDETTIGVDQRSMTEKPLSRCCAERGKQKAFLAKGFDGLACGADARERVEEMSDSLPDLRVGIERHVTGLLIDQPGWQGAAILATPYLVEDSAA
jgi:hypothetical protein